MNVTLEEVSTSQGNGDSGSEALIAYMRSHCNPVVELFSASTLNELTGSTDKVVELSQLCVKSLQSRDATVTSASSLMYLCHVIRNASPDVVYKEYKKWSTCIQQAIVAGGKLQHAYLVLKTFLAAVKKCPEANREFSTGQLPTLLLTLMSFQRTKSQVTIRLIMSCVSVCLHHYPFLAAQHYDVLYSWAIEGLANVDAVCSRESSRLLALLSSDVSSWQKTVHKLCHELNFLTTAAFAPVNNGGAPLVSSLNDSIFPPLPTNEPHRIATITLYYQSVTRSLVYLLSFRLSAGPVSIPLQLLMSVVCQPFTMFPDRLAGRHALEVLLLKSALPLFYSTMFVLLEALIKCVGTHLLSYSTVINQLFVHTMTWTAQNYSLYQELRYAVYHCINVWLTTNKCFASCDHLISMVIKDTATLAEERTSISVPTLPKRKKRKLNSELIATSCAQDKSNVNERLIVTALSAVNSLLQFCGPIITSSHLEDFEDHMIKSLSHDHHSAAIKMMLLRCAFHLINASSCQYTPPVSQLITIITGATCSEDDQVKLTALQLINQCDITVMSSFVPHPLPHLLQHSVTGVQSNKQSLSNALRPVENSGCGSHLEQELIMIDDISSNEGVTNSNIVAMENSNSKVVTMENEGKHNFSTDVDSQAIVKVDESHGSTCIDLDQDDDDDDIAVALEKFIDQSSDEST